MTKMLTQGNKQQEGEGQQAPAPYRGITVKEKDMLFSFYEKHNGNMMAMIRDKDCIFKGYNQIRYYSNLFNFADRLVEIRRNRATEVVSRLGDGKIRALEHAMRLLEPKHTLLFDKRGLQVFDADNQPVIMETLPHYKEIQAAWEMIKTELGEPTTIGKTDITSKGQRIGKVQVVIVAPTHANTPRPNDNAQGDAGIPEKLGSGAVGENSS
jgi:hypothetical protein